MYNQAGGYITENTSTYDFIIRICGSEFQWNNADRKQAENRLYRSQSQFATFLSHTIRERQSKHKTRQFRIKFKLLS